MNLLVWAVLGIISGLIANWADPDKERGILGSIILGILGATLGGMLAEFLLGVQIIGFNFAAFIVAVLGSLVLLFSGRMLRRI